MPLVFLQALTIHMVDHVKAADWVIPPSLIHPNSAAAVAAAAAAALQRTRRAADDEEDEGVGRRQRGGGGGGGGGVEAAAPEVEVGLCGCCEKMQCRANGRAFSKGWENVLLAAWRRQAREISLLAAWRRQVRSMRDISIYAGKICFLLLGGDKHGPCLCKKHGSFALGTASYASPLHSLYPAESSESSYCINGGQQGKRPFLAMQECKKGQKKQVLCSVLAGAHSPGRLDAKCFHCDFQTQKPISLRPAVIASAVLPASGDIPGQHHALSPWRSSGWTQVAARGAVRAGGSE
eukprot:1150701-Pelagomonas_calceolata.AAC.3